jgi:non-ribosomal peptide synthetase component F
LLAWTQGAELVVADLNGITAINAFKAIHDHQVDFVTLPPSALFYLRRLKMLNMKQPWVTKTLFTGEALPYSVVQEWLTCAVNSTVDNAYGPTEGTVWSMIDALDDSIESQLMNGLCPIGQPLKTIDMRIVDEKGIDVEEGEQGELWIGGPQIFHGYLGQPEKTMEVLFHDTTGIYWYKTGDIVFKNAFDKVMYVNRKDNQVQVNGYRVELGEVEHHLRQCIGHDAGVVLAQQENGVTALFAFVEGTAEEQVVLAAMREKVPGYMLPRNVFSVPHFPINTSGKIDKQTLRKNYLT